MKILGINIKQLINLSYITATTGSHFTYINYFLVLMFDLFLIWLIFLYLYIFKKKKETPLYNIFRRLSWASFYLCILLIILLFSREYSIPFLSMRLLLELFILILLVILLYFIFYFIFRLKKDTISYYKEITKNKYLPKKKKNKKKSKRG